MKSVASFAIVLLMTGVFAPFATAQFTNPDSGSGFYSSNYGSSVNTWQSSRPTFDNIYGGSIGDYWPILTKLEKDQCESVTSDFIIGIPPGGCSPAVVRSDLLAEQRVPVFCQLSAIRVNPFIDVSSIKSISFKGDYPKGVSGISFHPARAATRSFRTLIGDPVEENIGYVVIILDRQPNERDLEKEISGMLTATIRYDAQGAFGTGQAEYYLEPISDEEWESKAPYYSFWAGKGYLRATAVDSTSATLEVMSNKQDVMQTITLQEGETSSLIYYPGYYCTAAMKVKLNKIDNSADMARIEIDGDPYWVRQGSRLLDGKCSVRDLNVFSGGGGKLEISCSGSERFTLVIGDEGVTLNNGNPVQVLIGGSIKGTGDKDYYLAYYGRSDALKSKDDNLPLEERQNPRGDFIVLFDRSLSEDEVSLITAIFENGNFETRSDLDSALGGADSFKGDYGVVVLGENYNGISFSLRGTEESQSKYDDASGIPEYLEKAKEATVSLVGNFSSEQKENGEYFGEEALYKQIMLAGQAGDESMQEELISLFLKEYPGSKSVEYIRDLRIKLEDFDFGQSSENVFVNNEYYNIRLDGFASGSEDAGKVDVRLNGGHIRSLEEGKIYDGDGVEIKEESAQKTEVPRLKLLDISGSGAQFSYVWQDADKSSSSSKTFSVEVGEHLNVGGLDIFVSDTNVREVAYVSLLPEVRNTKTEANFTFNIGVENRNIEINPEKAQKKIVELNKTIAQWEERLGKLEKLIKGLKGACYAVSAVLIVKSMFSGFMGGESIARGKVMSVYEAKCRGEGAKTSFELQECYSKYKDEIEKAIDSYGSGINSVNEKVKCAETEQTVSSGFLESKVINTKAYVDALKICSGISESWSYKLGETTITKEHLDDASDFQAALLYQEACEEPDSIACDIAKKELDKALSDNAERVKLSSTAASLGVTPEDIYVDDLEARLVQVSKVSEDKKVGGVDLKAGTYYKVITSGNKEYVYEMKKRDTGSFEVVNIYNGGKNVGDGEFKGLENKYSFVNTESEQGSCTNKIVDPYVRYYESGNKQGFAAVVPFDINNGWYAYLENSDYSESGVANFFWVCNVGADGRIGDGTRGGDKCVYFRSSSGSDVLFSPCPTMSSNDVKRLYSKAEAAIREANRNGNGLTVDGRYVGKTAPIAATSANIECTDFMSVDDCNLMFNVCDPVICPTSRCDLGGAFPVSDVIQTGIIGSIALCLPNFGMPDKGGVLIPVCLTGIHAGLDSYLSILKSYRDCLKTNVESGVYTGICDEITAIYACEFFWGQLSPILDTLLMRFVEGLYGGFQTRGGAEYLVVQKAFENLDKSVDYFTSYYAEGAFRAFKLKNTEEIGSTVCKGFIGSSVPTSADAIDSLLEPESPTQFYAYFSESLFSEATVPSTSHYKVYYHIYAGNDAGAQFRVYLRNPPETSYYSSRQALVVDSGYLSKGKTVDEAIDFTAPTGYKELCVSINGEDECGFGSVTSNFAVEYASQQYVADQASDVGITKTSDCVTTSTSAWGMVGPNVQSGVETSLGQEDIANAGVVRICASTNPSAGIVGGNYVYCDVSKTSGDGKTNPNCAFGYTCKSNVVDEESGSNVGSCVKVDDETQKQMAVGRWIDMGYCDDASVRCWLDTESVEGNLKTYMAVNNISSVNELVLDSGELKELNEEYKNVREKLNVQKSAIEKLTEAQLKVGEADPTVNRTLVALDEVAGVKDEYTGQGTNADKAEAMALKASLYRRIVEVLLRNNPALRVVGAREVLVDVGCDKDCPDADLMEGYCDNGVCKLREVEMGEEKPVEEKPVEPEYSGQEIFEVVEKVGDSSSYSYYRFNDGKLEIANYGRELDLSNEEILSKINWYSEGDLAEMNFEEGIVYLEERGAVEVVSSGEEATEVEKGVEMKVTYNLIGKDELGILVNIKNNGYDVGEFVARVYKAGKSVEVEGSLKEFISIEKGKSDQVVFNTNFNPVYDRDSFKDGFFVTLSLEEGNELLETSNVLFWNK